VTHRRNRLEGLRSNQTVAHERPGISGPAAPDRDLGSLPRISPAEDAHSLAIASPSRLRPSGVRTSGPPARRSGTRLAIHHRSTSTPATTPPPRRLPSPLEYTVSHFVLALISSGPCSDSRLRGTASACSTAPFCIPWCFAQGRYCTSPTPPSPLLFRYAENARLTLLFETARGTVSRQTAAACFGTPRAITLGPSPQRLAAAERHHLALFRWTLHLP